MSFVVAAESYDRFMGRYSGLLAPIFADFAGVRSGHMVLEVGCGPGALATELVGRLGAGSVTAIDPSEPFVAAARERLPGVRVLEASAENLPFAEGEFDVTLAQLVVHHMADPVAGVGEMARVTRAGGTVGACVWDLAAGRAPLGPFWRAVKRFDPEARDESDFPGAREGELVDIFHKAGISDAEGEALTFDVEHASFEEWWEPFTLGVGPAGHYVADLDPESQASLAEMCREEVPPQPFTMSFAVWAARGSAPTHTM
jgi:SAM-dependent methyltransferase